MTQAVGPRTLSEALEQGIGDSIEAPPENARLDDLEAVKTLPAGSCVRDGRGRVWFRTRSNGWVSIASTHCASMYLALPVEVLYHGEYEPNRKRSLP